MLALCWVVLLLFGGASAQPTSTATVSPSQSSSGYPQVAILGSPNSIFDTLAGATSILSTTQVGGTILYFPDVGTDCNRVALSTIFLALSSTPAQSQPVVESTTLIELYAYDPGDFANISSGYSTDLPAFEAGDPLLGSLTLVASVTYTVYVISITGWQTLPVEGSFNVDVNASSFWVLTWRTTTQDLLWTADFTQVGVACNRTMRMYEDQHVQTPLLTSSLFQMMGLRTPLHRLSRMTVAQLFT